MDFENLHFKGNDSSIENQLEKPQKLYRGMRERNRESFDPKENISKRDSDEKSLVFATPDKAFATMFLVPEASDSWTIKGRYDGVWVHIIADEDLYKELDTGGSVYEITDLDDFYCEREKGMKECEWTCDKDVFPSSSEEYENSVDAMIENGVQVYFVDDATFLDIVSSGDKGTEILNKLRSENQKRNKNVLSIQTSDEDESVIDQEEYQRRQERMDRFLSQYYTRNFQNQLSKLNFSEQEELREEMKANSDMMEDVLMNGKSVDFFSQQAQNVLHVLQKDIAIYKKRDPKSCQRFISSQMQRIRE